MNQAIDFPNLQELIGWYEITEPRNPKTGNLIHFDLKTREHTYLYFRGPMGTRYCYTPHPDTAGNYWTWTYQPFGRGARSGHPVKFRLVHLVRSARRKIAKQRASRRCSAAFQKEEQHVGTKDDY